MVESGGRCPNCDPLPAMTIPTVTDELWDLVRPLLPVPARRYRYPGRKRRDDCTCLDSILYMLAMGIAWEQVPQQCGWWSGACRGWMSSNGCDSLGTPRRHPPGSPEVGVMPDLLALSRSLILLAGRRLRLSVAAGVGAVYRSTEVRGHDLEPGGRQHRLQQPAEGADTWRCGCRPRRRAARRADSSGTPPAHT